MKSKLNRSLPESTLSHDLLQKITPDTGAQVYYDYYARLVKGQRFYFRWRTLCKCFHELNNHCSVNSCWDQTDTTCNISWNRCFNIITHLKSVYLSLTRLLGLINVQWGIAKSFKTSCGRINKYNCMRVCFFSQF